MIEVMIKWQFRKGYTGVSKIPRETRMSELIYLDNAVFIWICFKNNVRYWSFYVEKSMCD